MNLIKMNNGLYLNKDNGKILDEREVAGIDISSNDCQKETTKKISKNKKKIKALQEEVQDDIIKEADTIKE